MVRLEIRPLEQPDLEPACDVLGFAFADNPNTLVLAGGDPSRAQRIMRVAARVGKLGRLSGRSWIAEADGQLSGVLHAAMTRNEKEFLKRNRVRSQRSDVKSVFLRLGVLKAFGRQFKNERGNQNLICGHDGR